MIYVTKYEGHQHQPRVLSQNRKRYIDRFTISLSWSVSVPNLFETIYLYLHEEEVFCTLMLIQLGLPITNNFGSVFSRTLYLGLFFELRNLQSRAPFEGQIDDVGMYQLEKIDVNTNQPGKNLILFRTVVRDVLSSSLI